MFGTGDDLSISLFFMGSALTLGVGAMSIDRSKHAVAVTALWALAGVACLAGAGWSWIKTISPRLADVVTTAASSGAWFFVVVIFLSALVVAGLRRGNSAINNPSTASGSSAVLPPAMGSAASTRRVFHHEEIRISELPVAGEAIIEDRTFINCILYGPAVIFFSGCTMNRSEFGFPPHASRAEDMFIEVANDH